MNYFGFILALSLFVCSVNGRLHVRQVEEEEDTGSSASAETSESSSEELKSSSSEETSDSSSQERKSSSTEDTTDSSSEELNSNFENDLNEDHEVFKRQATDQFRERALQAHNEYRARHGCPSLTLDDNLNREAQAYAMEESRTNVQKHSCGPCDKYGENLAYTAGTQQQPKDAAAADWACKAWYDEIKVYNFQNPNLGSSHAWGHLTALLWKATTKMGIGVAYGTKVSASGNKMNTVYVVARYFPAGNVWDANILRQNVPPPRF